MRKIMLIGHDGERRLPYEKSVAWQAFANTISENNYEIVEEFSDEIFAVIFNSHKRPAISESDFASIPIRHRVLILWEPYIVETERYQPDVLANYGQVHAPSVLWARRVAGRAFKWPQDPIFRDPDPFLNWDNRLSKIVMIQGNKFSARKGELYSLRRRILVNFSEAKIDLYGTNWNSGVQFDWLHWSMSFAVSRIKDVSFSSIFGLGRKYSNYIGTSSDKQETLGNYQICLVIENSADFVSEKLFDALRAGCLTIYVGANLEDFGLTREVALTAKKTLRDVTTLLNQVLALTPTERLDIAKRQREEILKYSYQWENVRVLPELAKRIINDFSKPS